MISSVTDAVADEVKAWQSRPLEPIYPIVYLDCIHVKVRDTGVVRVKAVYLAIGINLQGEKEILGLWIAQTEGAKFWLHVVTELKNRGVQDIFIACVDGLKGFPEALETVYPKAAVQLCIVHLVRNSLNYVSWKMRKPIASDLKPIYQSATVAEAEQRLAEFEAQFIPRLPRFGDAIGVGSSRFSTIRQKYAGSSTRPMPSNRLIGVSGRLPKIGVHFPAMRHYRSCSILP